MILLDEMLVIALIFLLGLLFGSFATAVSYRVPRGEQFITGRSHCPKCKHNLGFLDLFPLISWFWLQGKCRYCHVKFGGGYPMVESILALMFVAIYVQMGITFSSAIMALIATTIMILITIDFEHYIITDGTNLTLFCLGVVYQFSLNASWQFYILGPLVGVTIGLSLRWFIKIWKKREGLGMGDVKFLAAAGVLIPFEALDFFLFLSGIIGMATAMLWKLQKRGERFPFGPSLSMALFIIVVFPEYGQWWKGLMQHMVHSLLL